MECAQKELQAAEQLLTLSTVVGGDTSQLTSTFQDVAIYYKRLVNEIAIHTYMYNVTYIIGKED